MISISALIFLVPNSLSRFTFDASGVLSITDTAVPTTPGTATTLTLSDHDYGFADVVITTNDANRSIELASMSTASIAARSVTLVTRGITTATTNPGFIRLRGGNIHLEATASSIGTPPVFTSGVITTAAVPIRIEENTRDSLSDASGQFSFKAPAGSIYLSSNSDFIGSLLPTLATTVSLLSTGTYSLRRLSGGMTPDLTLGSNSFIHLYIPTLELHADAGRIMGGILPDSTLYVRNLTATARDGISYQGSIRSSSLSTNITLKTTSTVADTGGIGTSTNPLTVFSDSAFTLTRLTVEQASMGTPDPVYLQGRSSSGTILFGTYTNVAALTLSVPSGNLVIPTGTVSLASTDLTIDVANGFYSSAAAFTIADLTIEARGDIYGTGSYELMDTAATISVTSRDGSIGWNSGASTPVRIPLEINAFTPATYPPTSTTNDYAFSAQ